MHLLAVWVPTSRQLLFPQFINKLFQFLKLTFSATDLFRTQLYFFAAFMLILLHLWSFLTIIINFQLFKNIIGNIILLLYYYYQILYWDRPAIF